MFYLLLFIYLLPLAVIAYWLVRLAFWLVKQTVRLAFWLVRKPLVLLGKVLCWSFVSLIGMSALDTLWQTRTDNKRPCQSTMSDTVLMRCTDNGDGKFFPLVALLLLFTWKSLFSKTCYAIMRYANL